MCEFCLKHGEGKTWYLQARNYGLDLASDLRRRRYIGAFFEDFESRLARDVANLGRLQRAPRIVQWLVRRWVTRRQKALHFGQVLPLEDVREVLKIAGHVVRTPCMCRSVTRGDRNARYCFGVSASPKAIAFSEVHASYVAGPDVPMAERLSPEAALEVMADLERQGLVHSVWTFLTPFIAGICNCDRSDCIAMISTVGHDLKNMFKAEYVAGVNWDLCRGCRACMRQCQFGAIAYSAAADKCTIDETRCWGCGVCRVACSADAISLTSRNQAAGLGW